MACLFLQAEVAIVTPNKFMSGKRFESLGITNVSVVSRSLDSPYSGDRDVTDSNETLDFSGLGFVQGIGENFFFNCEALTAMDLSGMTNVTTIHDGFLLGCTELTTLDLSGLTNVTTIGSHFLYQCMGLTRLDLSGLSRVTRIGKCFLQNCQAVITHRRAGRCSSLAVLEYSPYRCTPPPSWTEPSNKKLYSVEFIRKKSEVPTRRKFIKFFQGKHNFF